LRIKPRHRLVREKPLPMAVPIAVNQSWSMAFIHDQLAEGCSIRLFNVIDHFSREGLGLEVDLSLPSERVIRSLGRIIDLPGKRNAIRCDNGPSTSVPCRCPESYLPDSIAVLWRRKIYFRISRTDCNLFSASHSRIRQTWAAIGTLL
jgi:hypothetical protein